MRAERTRDMALVKRLMTHPRVYPWLSDDSSPPPEQFQPVDSPYIFYVLVSDNSGDPLGVFMFVAENAATVAVHTCIDPGAWGRAVDAAALARAWIWENTDFVRITTVVPENNPLAERLAVRAGMTQYGRNPKSYRKGGQLYDLNLYGLSKE